MSFFSKIKQWLGMGTVSVQVQCPPSFSVSAGTISGTVTVTGKSDQVVDSIEVKLEEEFTTGRGDDKETKTYTLGQVKLPGFEIKTGESKTVEFTLPFAYSKTNAEELAEKGGALGGLGKMAKFANAEKSVFEVRATADVKGAALDPDHKVQVQKAS